MAHSLGSVQGVHRARATARERQPSRVSRGSKTFPASSLSVETQRPLRMQTTDSLLSELFPGVLQQSLEQPTPGGHDDSRRGSAREPKLTTEAEAKIEKVIGHYESCMQELASVERHLLQAKARALTEQEKMLLERKQAVYGYESISLPSCESPLGFFLNKELLEKNHLLHPTHYILPLSTFSSSHLHVPRESTLTYLQPTFTSTQHTTAPHDHTLAAPMPPKQKPSWKDQPTPAERKADRKALARLKQRGDYLCNPRYSSRPQPNTSSHGTLVKRQKQSEKMGQSMQPLATDPDCPARKVQLFVAEPSQVMFTDYQVGHTYKVNVDIRNVSGCSRQMRIIPLNYPYFTVTRGVSSHPEGLIAPGMHVSCTVTFTPPSLCNYKEEMKVQSHSGPCIIIPVIAARPPPCLSLPENIDCGSCLAGGVREMVLQVENSGGEGRFSIRHPDTQQPGSVLQLGPFSLSPTEFHLTHDDSTTLQVTFSPAKEGRYGEHFTMECDNGEAIAFSLTGTADMVSVGCVYVGNSSSQEISQFTTVDNSRPSQQVDLLMNSIAYELYTDPLEECNAVFETVNPQTAAHKTIVIRNNSRVDLPFSWKMFKPLTELEPSNEEDPAISSLVPSANSPFSMFPSSGILPASSNHTFLCQFLPKHTGQFLDAAHLLLPNVPTASLNSDSEWETWRRVAEDSAVSCVCLFLTATAQPYVLELQPPALLLPAPIPLATDIRQRVKMMSHSVSTLYYRWRQPSSEDGIIVTPASGSLVSGGSAYCEVVIGRREEGEFSFHLVCDIEHSPHPSTLPLHGWTQGPQLSVDCASLQFGLIPLGTSSQLTLTLTSHTNTSITVLMRQAVREESSGVERCDDNRESDVITDHTCLHFTPSTLTLPPHSITTVTAECRPLVTGRLRSIVQCVVEGKVIRCVSVFAEVQCPVVTLAQCHLHEDTAYVGVGIERTLEMNNTSLIPTDFTWRKQVFSSSGDHCSVTISPLSGSIGPRETLPITVTATWDALGTHPETILCCDVVGMEEPLLLELSGVVHGLAVSYAVQDRSTEDVCLDFGCDNALFTPHILHLLVTNTTAIPAHLTTHVQHFPHSHTTSPHHPQPPPQKRSVLSRTVNIGDPNSKTPQQANRDYMCGLLREGRGCCFVVDPPSSPLLPFTTHTLTITAYSDMWGDYHDTLICQVAGLDAVEVPIHCGVSGCPLVFHSTALPQHSLVRFGSHSVNSPPVQRMVRINNTSPEEIRVDWQMYNILQEDSNLVDVITTIGPPFPRHSLSHSPPHTVSSHPLPHSPPHTVSSHPLPHSPPHTVSSAQPPDRKQISDCRVDLGHSGDGMEPRHSGTSECVDGNTEYDSQPDLESSPIVHVFLRGHEGIPANKPFSVHPTQMLVPARGQSSVTFTFLPESSGLESGRSAYCLGYISLDHQSQSHVCRVTGYELAPLRVDLEASVEQPQLHLEADTDNGLHFSYPASILLQGEQVLSRVSKTHHVTLVNLTSSILSFTLSCSTPHFTVIPSPSTPSLHHCDTRLSPHTAISVGVQFHLSRDDLKGCTLEKITYSDILLVHFSTGALQEFPLSAEILVPHMSVSVQALELGPCLLTQSLSSSLTLCNTTPSAIPWTLNPVQGLCDVLSVSPSMGLLSPHLNAHRPSSQHIHITFTPDAECEYSGSVVVREVLTECEEHVTVTGSGTTDEIHTANS